MFFDAWHQIWRVVVAGVTAYCTLVVLLRASGKRTLAKLNAFDLVVTIAIGSTLATIVTSSGVAITEGVVAFVVLLALQFVVAWCSARSPRITRAVRAEPTMVVCDGRLLDDELRSQRLTVAEVEQAIRAAGVGSIELVAAVVLESDGSMSVITTSQSGSWSVLPPAVRD